MTGFKNCCHSKHIMPENGRVPSEEEVDSKELGQERGAPRTLLLVLEGEQLPGMLNRWAARGQ